MLRELGDDEVSGERQKKCQHDQHQVGRHLEHNVCERPLSLRAVFGLARWRGLVRGPSRAGRRRQYCPPSARGSHCWPKLPGLREEDEPQGLVSEAADGEPRP